MFSGMAELSPEPAAQYCPQSRLEPILLAYARDHGGEARYGAELLSFEQHESGVTAVVRELDSQELETVHADYLVAADGVHSPVRQTLGVTTAGYGPLPIYVVFVYFRAPWRAFVPSSATGMLCRSKTLRCKGYSSLAVRSRHVHQYVLSRQGRNGCAVHTATMPRIDPQCRRRRL